jgi:hypothetical protein
MADTAKHAAPEEIPEEVTAPKTIRLFSPDLGGLTYGANNEIQFGARGGFQDGYWEGDPNDPRWADLLPKMLAAYPAIGEAETPVAKLYICDICEAEFKTKLGLGSHKRSHKA